MKNLKKLILTAKNQLQKNFNNQELTKLYYSLMIIKYNGVDITALEDWATKNNNQDFLNKMKNEANFLTQNGYLKFDDTSKKFSFVNNEKKEELFKTIAKSLSKLDEGQIVLKNQKVTDRLNEAYKKFDEDIIDNGVQEFLNKIKYISSDYSFNNLVLITSQLDYTPTELRTFKRWANTETNEGQIRILKGAKGLSYTQPQKYPMYKKNEYNEFETDTDGNKIPVLDEEGNQKFVTVFSLTYAYDISQTNASTVAYSSYNQMQKDYNILNENLKKVVEKFGIINNIEDPVKSIEFIFDELSKYYLKEDTLAKNVFKYIALNKLDIESNLDEVESENVTESLKRGVNTFKALAKELDLKDIIESANTDIEILKEVNNEQEESIGRNKESFGGELTNKKRRIFKRTSQRDIQATSEEESTDSRDTREGRNVSNRNESDDESRIERNGSVGTNTTSYIPSLLGKNIYDVEIYQDETGKRYKLEEKNHRSYESINVKNQSSPTIEQRYDNFKLDYLTDTEFHILNEKNHKYFYNGDVKIQPELNNFESFLNKYYSMMGYVDKNDYQDIIDNVIDIRTVKLMNELNLTKDEFLSNTEFDKSEHGSNNIGYSVFGITDTFKSFEEFLNEIKRNEAYKTLVSNKKIDSQTKSFNLSDRSFGDVNIEDIETVEDEGIYVLSSRGFRINQKDGDFIFIGKNKEGKDLYLDEQGLRIVDKGVILETEPTDFDGKPLKKANEYCVANEFDFVTVNEIHKYNILFNENIEYQDYLYDIHNIMDKQEENIVEVTKEVDNILKLDEVTLHPNHIEITNLLDKYGESSLTDDEISTKIKEFGKTLKIDSKDIINEIGLESGLSENEIEAFIDTIKESEGYEDKFLEKYCNSILDELLLNYEPTTDYHTNSIEHFISEMKDLQENKITERIKLQTFLDIVELIDNGQFSQAQKEISTLDDKDKEVAEIIYESSIDNIDESILDKVVSKTQEENDLNYNTNLNPEYGNFSYVVDNIKKEITVSNLKEHYSVKEIEEKFIKKGVVWTIFADKYIFDLNNTTHRDLLKNELNIRTIALNEFEKKEKENSIKNMFTIEKSNGSKLNYFHANSNAYVFKELIGFSSNEFMNFNSKEEAVKQIEYMKNEINKIDPNDSNIENVLKAREQLDNLYIAKYEDSNFVEKDKYVIEGRETFRYPSTMMLYPKQVKAIYREIDRLPNSYITEDLEVKHIGVKLFGGDITIYITERDVSAYEDRTTGHIQAYGYFKRESTGEGEWGYINVDEYIRQGLEMDLYLRERFIDKNGNIAFNKADLINDEIKVIDNNNNSLSELEKAYQDDFFGWTKTDVLEALREKDLDDNILNGLIEKYDNLNNAYAEEQEERLNKELEDTPYKVSIFQTSENYDEEFEREESDEYWNLAMYEATIEYKETEEELENLTTGRYVETESVVEELERNVIELKKEFKLDSVLNGEYAIEKIENNELALVNSDGEILKKTDKGMIQITKGFEDYSIPDDIEKAFIQRTYENSIDNEKSKEIKENERFGAGFLGGVDTVIWDREVEEFGDYKTVARIDKGVADIKEGYRDNNELIQFAKSLGATTFKHEVVQEDIIEQYNSFINDDKRETYLIENADNININTLENIHNEENNSELASLLMDLVNDKKNENNENFIIDEKINYGGAKTKFKNNLKAIDVIRKVQNGNVISKDERVTLSKYVGWGGLPQAFYKNDGTVTKGWENEAEELKATLTTKEYEEARGSTLNAHYTPHEVSKAMWKALDSFGFNGGKVLESSVGIGNFIGTMPTKFKTSTHFEAVELDTNTSLIAKALYPKAKIHNMGFEDFQTENDKYVLSIGNPPFGDMKLFDKEYKNYGFSIHNYFLAKNIDKVQNNGVMAVVVSNAFLDSQDSRAREYIGERARLLGAIRLPNNAFKENANTEVTTDILFFQKTNNEELLNIDSWKDIGELNDTPINNWFTNKWEQERYLLGEWGSYGTMYQGGTPALIEKEGQNTIESLNKAIENFTKDNLNFSFVNVDTNISDVSFEDNERPVTEARVNSYFLYDGEIHKRLPDYNEKFQSELITTKLNSKGEEVELKDREIARIKGMISISEVSSKLRKAQVDINASDEYIETLRKKLNSTYDKFVKDFGYLNNGTNKRLFDEDVNAPFLLSLETKYDKGISKAVAKRTGEKYTPESATKADIFSKRTQRPYQRPTSAETIEDAYLIALNEYNYVNINYISELVKKDPVEVERYLIEKAIIFDDENEGLVSKEEYLSGNVKEKLKNTKNPRNIQALKTVIPADVEAININVQAGASWIPSEDMKDFITYITGDKEAKAHLLEFRSQWHISAKSTSAKNSEFGTTRVNALRVLEATLNMKQITVYDTDEDGNKTVNRGATLAVADKVETIKREWKDWIWKSEDRRTRLGKIYNDTFNVYAKREYDGSHLVLTDKVPDDIIELRPHQKNAIWRNLQNPTNLADHTVGTGKTFTSVGTTMEWKRTGRANKTLVVVPNHMTDEWANQWYNLYPNSNILVPTKRDFEKNRRKVLISKIATGDYDAVVIGHSQLIKIENDSEFEIMFLKKELDNIQKAIDYLRESDGKDGRTVKQIEASKDKIEYRIKTLQDIERDDNINFTEMGIDGLIVDELHEFKNLQYTTSLTRVGSLGNPQGSKKAFDLFIKVQTLLNNTDGKNFVGLTGTPISNSIAEMYTMQRYMQYQELERLGLVHFDSWVKQFAEIKTDWELSPSGTYKLATRMSKFNNMPELMEMYNQFADVITNEYINKQLAKEGKKLPLPKLKGGKPENVILERSESQEEFFGYEISKGKYNEGSLIYRSEHLPKGQPKKGDDNMLVIMSDARKASLDMRLIDESYGDYEDSKTNVMLKRLLKNYNDWNFAKGTQLIFCDLSTPKKAVSGEKARIQELIKLADEGDEKAILELDKVTSDELMALENSFSVYDDVKEKLIKAGIPESEIAFIHDAKTDLQKSELFAKVRSGAIRFLLGSTSKMGAGTNVQDRLIAEHHLDVPWRPSDLEQREGRIIRQGNKLYELFELMNENNFDYELLKTNNDFNTLSYLLFDDEQDLEAIVNNCKEQFKEFEIEILRYATKNTLDSRMWQTIESKAKFIEQLKLGNLSDREIEDLTLESANAGELKALSSGNPLMLEELTIKEEIKKLESLKHEHNLSKYRIETDIRVKKEYINNFDEKLKLLEEDNNKFKDNFDYKKFTINIQGKDYNKRVDAGAKIIELSKSMNEKGINELELGEYCKFKMKLARYDIFKENMFTIELEGKSEDYEVDFTCKNAKADGLTIQLTNVLKRIDEKIAKEKEKYKAFKEELPELKGALKDFPRQDELDLKVQRHREIMNELQDTSKQEEDEKLKNEESKEVKLQKKSNNWIDNNKEISTLKLLNGVDTNILDNIDYKVVGKCIVLNQQLEREDYLSFQKIFSRFGGEWDRQLQAIVFSEDGLSRMNDLLKFNNEGYESKLDELVSNANVENISNDALERFKESYSNKDSSIEEEKLNTSNTKIRKAR